MKWIIITIISAGILSLACSNRTKNKEVKPKTAKSMAGKFTPVVVLELFTSEGCSSCPSADNLLPQLAKLDAAVIPLSFHVDYWNRLGWKDPFSSAEYSYRQREYGQHFNNDGVYTPQLVVNGEYEMVGSDSRKAEAAIKKVLKENSSVILSVEKQIKDGNKIKITSHAEGELNKQTLEVALVQKNATMDIKAGENRGEKLSHTNVVRVLKIQELNETNETSFTIPSGLADSNWDIVLFTRNKSDLKITGAIVYSPAE
ncbi:MAG: DUF1223 domain-containing protein [Chitinophagaceae bacterium]